MAKLTDLTVGDQARTGAVPVEQLRALVRLLWPDEITPTAKRMIEQVCEQHEAGPET